MSRQRSTKAEQFNAKIHGLREIYKRLDSKTLPLPTGNDVANYLQWFQDVLQGLVREERPSLTEDKQRFDIQKYPAMAYVDLFKVLNKMVKVVPNCELGSEAFAKNILSIMASLIPFLPKEHLDSLPMMVVMYLSIWPETFHGYVFNLLCGYVMPVGLSILKCPDPSLSYAVLSCPSLLMNVLQYCPDSKQQAQFVETLMQYKTDVCLDIMAVIAYGPQSILNSAGQILLHYFPLGNSGASADDWQFMYESWYPVKCQNLSCMVPNQNHCVKICFDASYAASKCDLAPPVFICAKCSELASKEVPNFNQFFLDLLDPLGPVPTKCQGETCKGQGISSTMMCFSPECAKRNKNRGTAMCQDCNERYHGDGEGSKHVVQSLIPDPWTMKGCEQAYVSEAVVRLLREAQPCQATRYDDMGLEKDKFHLDVDEDEVDNDINNRRMLSRFGIWLLVGICGDPSKCESLERLGRLVAMTIEWIDTTSSLMKDYVGELLKRLAVQRASKWLSAVRDVQMELFCACLSPYPPEYAKVGGCWDSFTSSVRLLIEGLHRVTCLIPYQLVDVEVWDTIMPLWMDAIKTNVPQDELGKFRVLLCKIFDPFISPFKLPSEISLGFVKKMLEDSNVYSEQVQALTWLQMLSTLEVVIKLHMLTSMFIKAIQNQLDQPDTLPSMFPFSYEESLDKRDSIMSSGSASSSNQEQPAPDAASLGEPQATADSKVTSEKEAISNLSSFIIMLDLLVKQVQLQRQREKRILNNMEREEIKKLLKLMLDISWTGAHGDHSASCQHCEMVAVWFQLAFMLFEAVFTVNPRAEDETLNAVAFGSLVRSGSSLSKAASFRSTGSRRSAQITGTIDEEVFDDNAADSRSTHASISACDPTGSIADQTIDSDGSQGQGEQSELSESATSFSGMRTMTTSIGSWRSGTSSATWCGVYDNYPQLQLLIGLLKELPKQQDHIVQYNMLKCVKILVIDGDYLKIAMDAEPEFLAYLQEIFFIPNLWDMIRAEHSNLSEICVEILLHCICLPYGAEKFCDNVENAFTDDDWRVRFAGVEKFTVIARFLDIEQIKSNKLAMSALAQSFTFLVGAVEDICTPVSTRAIAMLNTIKSSSLKTLYSCIEHQYDAAPKDRLLLIHTCRILHRTLPHYTPLCGQFFIRRFKHLLIENADYVSFGSPKARSPAAGGSSFISPMSETATPTDADGSKRTERWHSQSSSKGSSSRQSRDLPGNRSLKSQSPTFRCSYTFRMAGDKISYNRHTSNSSEGASTIGRQRRTGGFSSQMGLPSDITDRMFLGGRIGVGVTADNLSIVEEEADSERADNDSAKISRASLESAHSQEPAQATTQESGDLEAAATHQLVTLVMDFLAYPGVKETSSKFVKTESYEVVQMSHYLGVLMGYDIKVGEFTGDPRRLRLFPVFHAYMSGIVPVLDQNHDWGEELINLTLQLLLFCAAPKSQKRIEQPDFTLIRLSQPMRRTWLMTLLIILYKYPFFHDSHRRDTKNLITVVINTLEAHDHKCPGPRSAINKSKSTSMLDIDANADDGTLRPDTPGSPRYKRTETSRSSPTYKQRLSTCSTEVPDKEFKTEEDPKNLPLMAIHETSFVGPDSPQQKATTSTPLLEFNTGVGSSRGGSSGALTDEERNAELRPLIDGPPDKVVGKKAQGRSSRGDTGTRDKRTYFYNLARRYKSALTSLHVSVDSTTSRDTKDSLEGVLSIGTDDGRKLSRPKLLAGVSMRSMDHSIERSLDKFIETAGDKEPELQDIDLDVCPECGATLEEFDEETLNMAIVVLSTYVHQSPSMAMPYLLRMLECVGRKCVHPMFPWQDKSDVLVPGSNTEVAKQFLRCVLIKLAPNGIFSELFRTSFDDELLLKAIAYALNDYSAFDQMSPIAYLLEDILGFRTLSDRVMLLLTNLSMYFKHASKETTSAWSSQLSHFENFFRKLPSALPENCDITPAFQIMSCILTAANSSFKELLHPFGQVIAFGINKASFQLQDLLDLCSKCNETFPKERDKLCLTRVVVQELMQAVRFRSYLPDANLQALLQFLAIDAGSRVTYGGNRDSTEYSLPFGSRTRAMDCIQNYLIEIVEFIRDWHFTSRSSSENKRLSEPNLNLDTIPIDLKAAMSQLAALELTKRPKSSKLYTKSLTWLKNPPSASQLGPRELQECVSNMRLLTWILQGSLSHIVNSKTVHAQCQPIALEENVNVAKYVAIILHSFAEPLKDSLNITALYHAFHLCELWSLYCDIIKLHGEYSEQSSPIVLEFWGIVTPGILHLLTKSKEMCDLIGHNFLNLLEALQECNCTALPKLYPMWHPILTFCFSLKGVSEGSHNRLRKAQTRKRANKETRIVISKWLKQLRFKIALVEQSGANGQTLII